MKERHGTSNGTRRVVNTLVFCALLLIGFSLNGVAHAEYFPWKSVRMNVTYQDKPLKEVMRELFASVGKPVFLSEKIPPRAVTGKFTTTKKVFFEDMSQVFGLTSYYEGGIMYLYAATESSSRVISLNGVNAARLKRTLRKMGALDSRYMLQIQEEENLLRLSGPPRYLEVVEQIATKLKPRANKIARSARKVAKANVPYQPLTSTFKIYKLNYGWAQDTTMAVAGREIVVPGVASTLRRLVGNYSHGTRPATRGGIIGSAQSVSTLDKLRGKGLSARGRQGQPLISRGSARDSARSGPMGFVNVSLPRVEADSRTNSVIIHDLPNRMSRYDSLIAELDKKESLIQIEATVVDVSTDAVERLGIDFSKGGHTIAFGGGGDGNGRRTTGEIASSAANTFLGNTPLAGLSTVVGNMGRLFLAQVNLLASEGKAYVRSTPTILTTNNSEAVIENTRTFFVRVAGRDEVDLFNVAAGSVLRVTPATIEVDGKLQIKMAIRIEDGAITGQVVDDIPVIQRTTVGTQAIVNEGQSLLIGGYAYEIDKDTTSKVPLLGDIPGLGALFTFKDKQVRRVERMFMITPTVIQL